MKSFEKKIRGLVYKCDEKDITLYILADEIADGTNAFLRTYFTGQNRTVTRTTFKVKINSNSMAFLDKGRQCLISVGELLNQVVELTVAIKHYNFSANGKKITGWNMQLIEMHPI